MAVSSVFSPGSKPTASKEKQVAEKPRYILGLLSAATNDPGACIMKVYPDGDYEYVAIGEERLSRKKVRLRVPRLFG
jgi:hypothetical protein